MALFSVSDIHKVSGMNSKLTPNPGAKARHSSPPHGDRSHTRSKQRSYRRRSKRGSSGHQKRLLLMQDAARARIQFLFEWADTIFSTTPELAHDVIVIARKIAMGTKIRIPLHFKRHLCHGCKHYLKYGVNARFRTHRRKGYGTWMSVTCLDCGHITRYRVPKSPASSLSSSSPTSSSPSSPSSFSSSSDPK